MKTTSTYLDRPVNPTFDCGLSHALPLSVQPHQNSEKPLPVSMVSNSNAQKTQPTMCKQVDTIIKSDAAVGKEKQFQYKQPPNFGTAVERPMSCEEAAQFLRVHPKTVKRMARSGELPGHFRFGRWAFYATELDAWMRTELHSSCHSCR